MGKARSVRTTERGLLPMLRRALSKLSWKRSRGQRGITVKKWRLIAGLALLGAIAGVIELGLPFDDFHRALRAELRQTEVDGSIVVVEVDDKTLNALGTRSVSRAIEAEAVEKLFAMGADRVFFDRAHADLTNPADDAVFTELLKKHPGQIYLGVFPEIGSGHQSSDGVFPAPLFREHAELVLMAGRVHPFGLSVKFPYSTAAYGTSADKEIHPSISAALARTGSTEKGWYRPDFGIDVSSIPSISLIEVVRGAGSRDMFAGRDVVIAYTDIFSNDVYQLPLGEMVPGSFFHVIGAHTLKRGLATDLGWLPPYICSVLFLLFLANRTHMRRADVTAFYLLLLTAPVVLDFLSVNVDTFPALLALTIGVPAISFRLRKSFDMNTGLLRLNALQTVADSDACDVFALKVRNFSSIAATLSGSQMHELLSHIIDRISVTEKNGSIAFEKDTFVWFRNVAESQDLESHARGIQSLFLNGVAIESSRIDLAVSIGVSPNSDAPSKQRIEDAIQAAEEAAQNRAIMVQAQEIDAKQRWLHLRTLSDLDEAMAINAVGIAYQPKVDLVSGEWVGAEALLRWDHPERGPMDPTTVIAMAEEHNRIDRLTVYILEQAARVSTSARAQGLNLKIAVNVSAVSLRSPNFLPMTRRFVEETAIDISCLIIEITETSLLQGHECEDSLHQLRGMGFELSIDDFGIGAATIDYLKRIPSSEVKIDRSFIRNIHRSADDRVLVHSMISMIHSLGRVAVAEGIEDVESLSILESMGCEIGQGYYFARPLSDHQLIDSGRKSFRIA